MGICDIKNPVSIKGHYNFLLEVRGDREPREENSSRNLSDTVHVKKKKKHWVFPVFTIHFVVQFLFIS